MFHKNLISLKKTLFLLKLKLLFKIYTENYNYLLAIGSTPDDGSSKNYISGPPMRAIVTHNFLLLPPLSFPALLLI